MDPFTLVVVNFVGYLVMTLMLIGYNRHNIFNPQRSHLHSVICFALAFFCFTFVYDDYIFKSFCVALGNSLIIMGGAFEYIAILGYSMEITIKKRKHILKLGLLLSTLSAFLAISDNVISYRIALVTGVLVVFFFLSALVLYRQKSSSFLGRVIANLLFLICLIMSYRIIEEVYKIFNPGSQFMISGESGTFLGLFIYMLVTGLGVILLLKEKDEIKLRENASKDYLTGVYNRMHFIHLANEILCDVKKNDMPKALILIDMDNFKMFNDRYGHSVGDSLLKEMADCIKKELDRDSFMGRFGGDEFFIFTQNKSLEEIESLLDDIVGLISKITYRKIPLAASIGIAYKQLGEKPMSFHQMFEAADKSMYEAKNNGGNHYVIRKI